MALSPGGRNEYWPCQSDCVTVSKLFDMRDLSADLRKAVSNLLMDQEFCSEAACLVTSIWNGLSMVDEKYEASLADKRRI